MQSQTPEASGGEAEVSGQTRNTGNENRFVRRKASGQFKESDDVGHSLKRDRQQKAKRKVKSGQGDRGDR